MVIVKVLLVVLVAGVYTLCCMIVGAAFALKVNEKSKESEKTEENLLPRMLAVGRWCSAKLIFTNVQEVEQTSASTPHILMAMEDLVEEAKSTEQMEPRPLASICGQVAAMLAVKSR